MVLAGVSTCVRFEGLQAPGLLGFCNLTTVSTTGSSSSHSANRMIFIPPSGVCQCDEVGIETTEVRSECNRSGKVGSQEQESRAERYLYLLHVT